MGRTISTNNLSIVALKRENCTPHQGQTGPTSLALINSITTIAPKKTMPQGNRYRRVLKMKSIEDEEY